MTGPESLSGLPEAEVERRLNGDPDRGPWDLAVEVIGATYPDAYLYIGSGDHVVLLCDRDTPRWHHAVLLTPDNARRLANALTRMADQSEETDDA